MDINEIKPYERNARYNEKAIPVVAESIKEFGLKGQIVLESRDNPVIVAGHTRVAACKLLGWTEIPDERIDYCDELTPEQIKAYRLADNRTAEIATWNKTLLQHEIKKIPTIDMSKYGFDFKSKERKYGAERLRTDSYYNLDLVNIDDCGKDGMPIIRAVDHKPERLLGFNYCKSAPDEKSGVHFFIDDYQFERIWNEPTNYTELLFGFDCVLTPDWSLYMDMPLPVQQWNIYRARAIGCYWQRLGLRVIPTLSWSSRESYKFAFAGLEKHGTYAVSTVGVVRNGDSSQRWRDGMDAAMKMLKPQRILLYGKPIGFDFGNVEVAHYEARGFVNSKG